jgi:CHAT domain-containing protein
MRWLPALAAVTFLGCGSDSGSLEGELRNIEHLLRTERFATVGAQIDGLLLRATKRHDARAEWRFRLDKAEALLGQESSFKEALTVLTSHGSIPAGDDWVEYHARQFLLQARAEYRLNKTLEADKTLDKATLLAAQARRPDLAAEAELRQVLASAAKGNFAKAELACRNALATVRRLGDTYSESKFGNVLGGLLFSQSRYEEALSILDHSRTLAHQNDAVDTEARAIGNMGLCYYRLGDYDNALAFLRDAELHFSGTRNQYEVQLWTGSAGDVYLGTGELPAAMESFKRAVVAAREMDASIWIGRWLTNLAGIAIDRKQWDAAESYNDEARKLKSKTNDVAYQASSLVNAGRIATGRGDLQAAGDLFRDALRKDSEDPTVVLDAHAGLAGLYAAKGHAVQAEAEFRNTIAGIDSRQAKLNKDEYRLSWLDSLISFYQQYVDFLMSEKQQDRALEAAESSRSKVLTGQPIRQLTAPGYRQLARQTRAALLEYWLSPNHSYLWVITPDKVKFHMLPPKSELVPLIRSYRAVVAGGRNPLEVASDTGLKLYNALLAPAIADARGATQFIIVPDDELYSLNFETLPDGNNINRFWIDRATVRISPSLNYLASNASRVPPHTSPKLLMIGDPVSSLPQYPHLEYASQEIAAVKSAMATAQPVVLQGAAATPDAYAGSKPGGFSFIHFSAHAAASAKRASALDSAVILSGPPDKCRLVARDVLSIPLNAELVTVSACRSAGGKTYGGEGLVGFAWAFMKAGAGNVIAGLWDVNDRSTLQLMTGLYSRIAAGAPVAEALRSSKLELIHGGGSYAKPFYWAPFELYTARVN